MNKKERVLLTRLYSVMKVPLPSSGGTATQSGTGYVSYAQDMEAVRNAFQNVVLYVRNGELEEADHDLAVLERWHQIRRQENWQLRSRVLTFRSVERDMEEEAEAQAQAALLPDGTQEAPT